MIHLFKQIVQTYSADGAVPKHPRHRPASRSLGSLLSVLLIQAGLAFCLLGNVALAEEAPTTDAPPAEAQQRKGFLDPEQKEQTALANSLKEHEIVWLDVQYPETEAAQKVLAIAKPSLIAETKGAVLLVHDKEQHADWPQIIRPLRMSLPEWGWFTFSVNLPDDIRIQQPERKIAAKEFDQVNLNEALRQNLASGSRVRNEPAADPANASTEASAENPPEQAEPDKNVDINLAAASKADKPKIPYQVRALSHIEKAVAHLRNENYQKIVMLVNRQSVELALHYIKNHQAELSAPSFALVLIETDIPEDYTRDLAEWLGKGFTPPVFDIVDSASQRAEAQAKLRKLAFERAEAKAYRQIFVPVSDSKQFHESLAKRIRLWLDGPSAN